jgi:hypothetical protein
MRKNTVVDRERPLRLEIIMQVLLQNKDPVQGETQFDRFEE